MNSLSAAAVAVAAVAVAAVAVVVAVVAAVAVAVVAVVVITGLVTIVWRSSTVLVAAVSYYGVVKNIYSTTVTWKLLREK